MTELPEEIAIGYSPWRLLELTLLGIIMTSLCGAIVVLIPVDAMLQFVVGYAGVAFFGAATCVAVWKLGCSHHQSSLTKVCRLARVARAGTAAVCYYLYKVAAGCQSRARRRWCLDQPDGAVDQCGFAV